MEPAKTDNKMILVVEDEFSIREALKEALESEDYRVVTAQNGRDGLEKIRLGLKPALVLLDMMMPVMGGQEFLWAVAADSDLCSIPVLVISSSVERGDVPEASGFVKKPVDLDELLRMVEKLIVRA